MEQSESGDTLTGGACPECSSAIDVEELKRVVLCDRCARLCVSGAGQHWTHAPCHHTCCLQCWKGTMVTKHTVSCNRRPLLGALCPRATAYADGADPLCVCVCVARVLSVLSATWPWILHYSLSSDTDTDDTLPFICAIVPQSSNGSIQQMRPTNGSDAGELTARAADNRCHVGRSAALNQHQRETQMCHDFLALAPTRRQREIVESLKRYADHFGSEISSVVSENSR